MEQIIETIYEFALNTLIENKIDKLDKEIMELKSKNKGYYHQKDLYRNRAKLLKILYKNKR